MTEHLHKSDLAPLKDLFSQTCNSLHREFDLDEIKTATKQKVITDLQQIWHVIKNQVESNEKEEVAVEEISLKVAQIPLIKETLEAIKKTMPELILDDEKLKDHLLSQVFFAIENLDGKQNSKRSQFLQEYVLQNYREIRPKLTPRAINKILFLQEEVSKLFGEKHRETVLLIYFCLNGDVELLLDLCKRQIRSWQKNSSKDKTEFTFFSHVDYFLDVYAEISQTIIEYALEARIKGAKNLANIIAQKSHAALYKIFINDDIQLANLPIYRNSKSNLFTVLAKEIPWIHGNKKDTPFGSNLRNIISFENDRQNIVEVFLRLNASLHIKRMEKLLLKISARKGIVTKEYSTDIIDNDINTLIQKAGLNFDSNPKTMEEKIEEVLGYAQDNFLTDSNEIKNSVTLLRIIDPRKIVDDSETQKDFLKLYKTIQKASKNDPILGTSLEIILQNKSNQYLEQPLEYLEKSNGCFPTIRSLLTKLVITKFDKNYILNGVACSSDEDPTCTAKPMIYLPDRENLSATISEIKKDFSTAASGIERKLPLRNAETFLKTRNFKEALRFAWDSLRNYLGDNEREYEFIFAGSGTDVCEKLISWIPGFFQKGDSLIAGQQEFKPILEIFERNQAKILSIDYTSFSSVDECVNEILQKIELAKESGTKIKMLWFSSHTRFGEAPFSFDDQRSNAEALSEVVKKLKPKLQIKDSENGGYKQFIPIAIDAVQSIGRSTTKDYLKIVKPDFCLWSTQKALGISDLGTGSISSNFRQFLAKNGQTLPIENPYRDENKNKVNKTGTIPIKKIIAMCFALNAQIDTIDPFCMDGNFEKLKDLMLEEKISQKMQFLTNHTIQQIAQINQSSETQINILNPRRRNLAGYNGLISLEIDALKGEEVEEYLKIKGYKVNAFPELSDNAFRISFHCLHEAEDIDNLIKTILNHTKSSSKVEAALSSTST